MREQQDSEYKAAEEADRIARLKKEQEEEELRRKKEEEIQQQELNEAIELSKSLSKQNRMLKIKERLAEEPKTIDSNVSTIKFQLPHGIKVSRNFMKIDKIQVIIIYLLIIIYYNFIIYYLFIYCIDN